MSNIRHTRPTDSRSEKCGKNKRSEMSKTDNYKEEFKRASGIDMTDFEYAGKFPKFNKEKQKWGMIARGKAWQMYAWFLEEKLNKEGDQE